MRSRVAPIAALATDMFRVWREHSHLHPFKVTESCACPSFLASRLLELQFALHLQQHPFRRRLSVVLPHHGNAAHERNGRRKSEVSE